ncbi:hypothetical protein AQUCO_04400010v1 [Aquilegia coerulea]|uniref:PAZ domain-containing protein n=1 Tax=Aquilegia coerulea TaxID=218851 RepID=A0A2G5CMK6_AQUCA|nr:hypothetical protein AQUCO_04400010v1 [Aquilegia coerulea]
MLKNMRVKARHSSMEFKIIGISEKACSHQYFPMKMRSEDGSTEEIVDIIEYECFVKNRKIGLDNSAYIPKCPNYLPLELCFIVSLRQYTKALSSMQRASLVEKSRQKPEDRIRSVTDDVKNYRFDDDPLLKACGMSIQKQSTAFEGRMLNAPTLKIGNGEDCIPHNGKWNFNLKQFSSPIEIKRWANVNFYARCDTSYLSQEMINSGSNKGIVGYVHPVFINWAAENHLLILSVKSWTQARADHNR